MVKKDNLGKPSKKECIKKRMSIQNWHTFTPERACYLATDNCRYSRRREQELKAQVILKRLRTGRRTISFG